MSKTREILRLRWAMKLSVREASRATGLATGTVSKTEHRAVSAGLGLEEVDRLSDTALEKRLYGGPKHWRDPSRPLPDPVWMHRELRRAGVTLELLHLEYLREHPDGYRYTAFCDHYKHWVAKLAKADVLVIDDLGLGTPKEVERHDLLEVMEDRYGRLSTVITSQLPIAKWHEWIGDPTVADAVLDRLVHNAYKLELRGNSRRKEKPTTN